MNKTEVLQRFANSRQSLLALIQDLPDTEWQQPGAEGYWSVTDLLAHIVSWEKSVLIPLRSYLQGGAFTPEDIPDHLAWNAEQEKLWQQQPLESILQELERVRAEILALVEKLEDEQWETILHAPWGGDNNLAQIIGGLVWHEEEHTHSILNWRSENHS